MVGRSIFIFFNMRTNVSSPLYLPPVFTTKPRLSGEGGQSWSMIEGPQPRSDPNGWGLLINIDGVFIGMAVGLNYSEGSGRHMGHLLQRRS